MKKQAVLLSLISIFILNSCTRVPITNRRQTNLFPESELTSMSLTEYKSFLSQHKLSSNAKDQQMVKNVGNKIAAAVTSYLKSVNKESRVEGYSWEFNLVEDPAVNAWCMPGGKVVVYTGLLPVTQNETGLAVVMGHEIAHAIARHGNERMSQEVQVQFAGMALGTILSTKSQEMANVFNSVYGVGGQLAILSYSRKHETEADKMGLVFMALAGYDPSEAITFWDRMSKSGGAKPPVLLSTHPSDEQRIKDLKAWLPEAMKYYKKPGA